MFEFKPDYEQSKQRIDAFWEHALIDRPVVQFALAKPPEDRLPLPPSHHASPAERWLDAEYQAELQVANLSNQEFLGDSMPVAYPNLGPEIFSVFYGCPVFFGDYGTSWTAPILNDWSEASQLRIDWGNGYLTKLHEMTDLLLEAGQGKFIVGMTDWHPGGDCLAAFRDPQNLAIDMLEHVDEIRTLLDRVGDDYYRIYDLFYDKLRAAGQPISTWVSLVCDGKFYIPSNDFSAMISKKMFDDVFLPGLVDECRFLDRSLYHVDGPNALRHLDSILGIAELDAVQWVPGAGREGFARWIPVYQKIQAAGKAMQVLCTFAEIDLVIESAGSPWGLPERCRRAVARGGAGDAQQTGTLARRPRQGFGHAGLIRSSRLRPPPAIPGARTDIVGPCTGLSVVTARREQQLCRQRQFGLS